MFKNSSLFSRDTYVDNIGNILPLNKSSYLITFSYKGLNMDFVNHKKSGTPPALTPKVALEAYPPINNKLFFDYLYVIQMTRKVDDLLPPRLIPMYQKFITENSYPVDLTNAAIDEFLPGFGPAAFKSHFKLLVDRLVSPSMYIYQYQQNLSSADWCAFWFQIKDLEDEIYFALQWIHLRFLASVSDIKNKREFAETARIASQKSLVDDISYEINRFLEIDKIEKLYYNPFVENMSIKREDGEIVHHSGHEPTRSCLWRSLQLSHSGTLAVWSEYAFPDRSMWDFWFRREDRRYQLIE